MKLLLTFVILLSCKHPYQYHIRIEPYREYYVVHYTLDNWYTFKEMYTLEDQSWVWDHEAVDITLKLMNYDEAVEFAKQFTSYSKIVSYDSALWINVNNLKALRKREYFIRDSIIHSNIY